MLKPDAALRKDKTNAGGVDTLQHRHLAAIAAIIAALPELVPANYADDMHGAKPVIARAFANRIGAGNSRFDRSRFLAACGVSDAQ